MRPSRAALALLGRAASEPAAALAEGEALLASSPEPDSAAVIYRAMSIAARNASTTSESIRLARLGADVARDETIRRQCLLTMAGSLAEQGEIERALDVLEEASRGAEGLVAGQLDFQKGSVLSRTGDFDTALAFYDRALPVFHHHERSDFEAMVLHNQGHIFTQTGRLAEAEVALSKARDIEAGLGRDMEVAGTDHNLGILASFRGDIPEALRRLTWSDEAYMRQAGDDVPRHVSRCEVLLSAGLFGEALDLARRIAAGAARRGRGEDEADALLVAARSAFLAGRPSLAVELAGAAADKFDHQERHVWSTQARLVLAEARWQIDGPSTQLVAMARDVAAELESAGFVVASARARLLAGRIGLALGLSDAELDLEAVGDLSSGTAELRIQSWLATALLRLSRNDKRGADSAARAGLRRLDQYQSGLGASDLRSGIQRQGRELGAIGLGLAAESGDPRRLLRWMELTRARALRHPPVLPDPDGPEQEILARLRQVTYELRDPGAVDDVALRRRQRQLQDELRRATRARRSKESQVGGFSLEGLMSALGDRTLLELADVAGRLTGVLVRRGSFSVVEIGDTADLESRLARLRFELRRTARMRRNHERVVDSVARFGEAILGELVEANAEIVLVPPGSLMAAPWAVLPALQTTILTVSPSAELWWRAAETRATGDRVVLAAGPDLENAVAEVDALHSLYPGSTVLGPGDGSADFSAAVKGARVAHAACHAAFEVENPMFSSLRLGDGDFNVYDLERVGDPPHVMVLSACDSGYTETRPGDELTGVTSALLTMGSKSVVASVGLVPDSEATSELMVEFHRRLSVGENAAPALSAAQRGLLDDPDGYIAAASFLCVGSG